MDLKNLRNFFHSTNWTLYSANCTWYIPDTIPFCISFVLIIPWSFVWLVVSRWTGRPFYFLGHMTSQHPLLTCFQFFRSYFWCCRNRMIIAVVRVFLNCNIIKVCYFKWHDNEIKCFRRKWKDYAELPQEHRENTYKAIDIVIGTWLVILPSESYNYAPPWNMTITHVGS